MAVWDLHERRVCRLQERLADKEARSLARAERNRLKAQDAAKRRQLEKLRQEQNSSVDDGEVRLLQIYSPTLLISVKLPCVIYPALAPLHDILHCVVSRSC